MSLVWFWPGFFVAYRTPRSTLVSWLTIYHQIRAKDVKKCPRNPYSWNHFAARNYTVFTFNTRLSEFPSGAASSGKKRNWSLKHSSITFNTPQVYLTLFYIFVTMLPGYSKHPFSPFVIGPVQEKIEMLSLPLANERRPCVLVGRDNMALPASLISQIGYRCHPSLYTEGDPGEKVELVAGRTTEHLSSCGKFWTWCRALHFTPK